MELKCFLAVKLFDIFQCGKARHASYNIELAFYVALNSRMDDNMKRKRPSSEKQERILRGHGDVT